MTSSIKDNLKDINNYNININIDSWKNAEQFIHALPTFCRQTLELFLDIDGNVTLTFYDFNDDTKKFMLLFVDDMIVFDIYHNNKKISTQNYHIENINEIIKFLESNINFY